MGKEVRARVSDVDMTAGPDARGRDWYVSFSINNGGRPHTWWTPYEARKVAKAILRLAKRPRAARAPKDDKA